MRQDVNNDVSSDHPKRLPDYTSFLGFPVIVSVGTRNKIFRSGFLGTVAQFTNLLGNDVIQALASDVNMTGLKTVKGEWRLRYLKDVSLKHHASD